MSVPHLMHSTAEAVLPSDLPCRAAEKPLFFLSKGCCACCAPDMHTGALFKTSTLVCDSTPAAIINQLQTLTGGRSKTLLRKYII